MLYTCLFFIYLLFNINFRGRVTYLVHFRPILGTPRGDLVFWCIHTGHITFRDRVKWKTIVILQIVIVWYFHTWSVNQMIIIIHSFLNWQGMVQAANYIKKKLLDERLLASAFAHDVVSLDYVNSFFFFFFFLFFFCYKVVVVLFFNFLSVDDCSCIIVTRQDQYKRSATFALSWE